MNKLKDILDNIFVNPSVGKKDRGLQKEENSDLGVDTFGKVGTKIMQLIDYSGEMLPYNLWKPLDLAWREKDAEKLKISYDLINYWAQDVARLREILK